MGAGAGGLELATQLGNTLGRRKRASVTLIDKSRIHVWKPLLHEVASGSFDPETESLELMAHAREHHLHAQGRPKEAGAVRRGEGQAVTGLSHRRNYH